MLRVAAIAKSTSPSNATALLLQCQFLNLPAFVTFWVEELNVQTF